MPNFRPLQINDAEKLIPLFKILTGKEILVDAKSLVNNNKIHCLVIEKDDALIGFGALTLFNVPTKGEVARIEDVVIDQDHQGKGFGKSLVLQLLEIARSSNISNINLTSSPMRVAAQKLYESVGFTRGNTDTFYINLS
jgi:ribosomal protein S18 acetylase RimI-like enzyme